jgi:hypothetical protein
MIDFDQLVLKKSGDIFSIAVQFTLVATAPGVPSVLARGVYSSTPVDVQMENETIFSDQQTSLGIRLRDFIIPPGPGDICEIVDLSHPHVGKKFWIGDLDEDGQGGAMLLLRTEPP